MATKRQKESGTFEYIVKNKKLLGKPFYYYNNDEAEGDAYIAKLEALLKKGIVPQEILDYNATYTLLAEVIKDYLAHNTIPDSDRRLLNVAYERVGKTPVNRINYQWVEQWIRQMKVELNLAPSTIRHHVGAMARCFDWAANKNVVQLVMNPIRQLPKRYAQYTDKEVQEARKFDPTHDRREDISRDRRLAPAEEEQVRRVMNGLKREDRERVLEMLYRPALILLFDMALETAMRMRESYTLTLDQVRPAERTIFLEKTKNGSKRQVPMTSVIVRRVEEYMQQVRDGHPEMNGFRFDGNRLFPWWDGVESAESFKNTTEMLSAQYARIFNYAGCGDFTFHDTRHEATSRLFERTTLSDTEIMKITGHSSTRMLARYANLRGSNLAARLW